MSAFITGFLQYFQNLISPNSLEIDDRTMSNLTNNRRRGRIMSRSRRHNNNNLITVDLELPTTREMPSCIDLTSEIDLDEPETVIVDLTSVNDSSIVCIGNGIEDYRPVSSRTRRRSRSPLQAVEVVEDDSITEDPDLPESDVRCLTSSSKSTHGEQASISCPICLDSLREITRSSRQLMSTVCGHIFCNICITESVRAHRKCPKCRRRLSSKQIHPIFL